MQSDLTNSLDFVGRGSLVEQSQMTADADWIVPYSSRQAPKQWFIISRHDFQQTASILFRAAAVSMKILAIGTNRGAVAIFLGSAEWI